jgi:hypothetical protein
VPLYFAGARLLEVFPVVPIMANVTLGIGALTCAGQFNIAVVAGRDTCPDIDVFVHGCRTRCRIWPRPCSSASLVSRRRGGA